MARLVHSSISYCRVATAGAGPRVFDKSLSEIPGMSFLKHKLSMPVVKYSALGIAASLWTIGLVDELYSSAAVMKYLLMSLLMAAVAFI